MALVLVESIVYFLACGDAFSQDTLLPGQKIASLQSTGSEVERLRSGCHRLFTQDRNSEALALSTRLCATASATASDYQMRGEIFSELGQWSQAVQCFKRSQELDPQNQLTGIRLIESLLASRDFVSAKLAGSAAISSTTDENMRVRLSNLMRIAEKGALVRRQSTSSQGSTPRESSK